jgi:hypothetical protein
VEKLTIPKPFMLLPELKGSCCHSCVWLIGTVSATNDARLASRRRSGIPRSPCVDQRHPTSMAEQVQCGPTPECARAYHCNFRFHDQDFARRPEFLLLYAKTDKYKHSSSKSANLDSTRRRFLKSMQKASCDAWLSRCI